MSTSLDLTQSITTNLRLDDRKRWRLDDTTKPGELLTAPHDLGASGRTIQLNWLTQWTSPLHFTKHPGNPIFGPHKSGPWDDWTNGVSVVPTPDGLGYSMYYAGRIGAGIGLAEGSVADPTSFTENPASPVLKPRADNWEGDQINQPRVVKVTDTHWRMYYTGWKFPGPGLPPVPGTSWAMGVADSFDGGTTWRQFRGREPFFDRGGPDSPDGGGACVPMVVKVGDRWMMWYTAGRVNPAGHQNIHLCLAYSKDGLHWEKHPGNPVLTDTFEDGAPRSVTSRCYVRHDDGVFRMWYSFAKPDYRICYAESLDGIDWERASIAPVLDASPAPAWDDVMVEYPEVQIVDGTFRLWFCGNGYGSVGYAEGVPETGVDIELRSGNSPTPDEAWTEWTAVERGQSLDAGRYVQVRAKLWSKVEGLSGTLNGIAIAA